MQSADLWSTIFLQKRCGQWSRSFSPSKHFFACALPHRKRLHSPQYQDSWPENKCQQQKHLGVKWGRVRLLIQDKKPEILNFSKIKNLRKLFYWEMCSTVFLCISDSFLLGWIPPLETKCAGIWTTWEKLGTGNCEAWTQKKREAGWLKWVFIKEFTFMWKLSFQFWLNRYPLQKFWTNPQPLSAQIK